VCTVRVSNYTAVGQRHAAVTGSRQFVIGTKLEWWELCQPVYNRSVSVNFCSRGDWCRQPAVWHTLYNLHIRLCRNKQTL